MEILSILWPDYMTKRSQEMEETDFIEMAFSLKFGVLMSNMKKISSRYPKIMKPWNDMYDHSVINVSKWYAWRQTIDKENAVRNARFVLNELILHDDIYYNDLESYKALFFKQETFEVPDL